MAFEVFPKSGGSTGVPKKGNAPFQVFPSMPTKQAPSPEVSRGAERQTPADTGYKSPLAKAGAALFDTVLNKPRQVAQNYLTDAASSLSNVFRNPSMDSAKKVLPYVLPQIGIQRSIAKTVQGQRGDDGAAQMGKLGIKNPLGKTAGAMAYDMVTDPISYAGFGLAKTAGMALTNAPKLAKLAGTLGAMGAEGAAYGAGGAIAQQQPAGEVGKSAAIGGALGLGLGGLGLGAERAIGRLRPRDIAAVIPADNIPGRGVLSKLPGMPEPNGNDFQRVGPFKAPFAKSVEPAFKPEPDVFYHGSGTADLTKEMLDPLAGNHESLFGHGVYFTDNPEIAGGYSKSRGSKTGDRVLYKATIKPKKIIDLESGLSFDFRDSVLENSQLDDGFYARMNEFASKRGVTNEQLMQEYRNAIADYSSDNMVSTNEFVENFQDIVSSLQSRGIDALTHTGGKRTGNAPHRVIISIDPKNNVQSFERYVKSIPQAIEQVTTTATPNVNLTGGKSVGSEPLGAIPEGMKERGVSSNVRTDMARPEELRDAISKNPMVYDQLANRETLVKAQNIYSQGLEPAVTRLNELLRDMKPEAAPLVKMIADDLTNAGQVDRARELLSNAAVRATEAGQFGQAFRILRDADPSTFLMTMDKQLRQMNEQGRKLYGKKWTDLDLTDQEKDAATKLQKGDRQAYDDLMGAIGDRIANEMPSSGLEKFDAWRRMAMLLNPKTHIRNIAGNTAMMGVRKTADTIAAGLESVFVKEGQRTKAVNWKDDAARVDLVNSDWEATAKDFAGEKVTLKNLTKNMPSQGRWEIDNMRALNREKRIFKNNTLEAANNFSRNTLNAEDYFFKERAYKDALGGFLKANKLTAVTDEAREYAKRRALEATFQDMNMFAEAWGKLRARPDILGKAADAALPFVKTPSNIVSRSIEYSPMGFLRLFSGKVYKEPAKVIEVVAQGLTGSGIAGLGYMLANMGWLRAEKVNSKNAEALMNEVGDQPYSLVTPLGSYTLDWLQPLAVPLFMGVSLYESLMRQDKIDPDTIAESIATGGDTIFNLSMLKQIKQLLGGGFGSVTEQIAGLPVSYVEQAFPTVLGQVARTMDDTKRNTYGTTGLDKLQRQLLAKTPGASKFLEPKLDIWGQEQKQGGAVQQFLNPGYALPKNNDPTTQEMLRLYRATKETDLLPKLFKGSFTVDGKKTELTPEQLTTFQREMGQENYRDISQVVQSPFYQETSDEKKANKIRKIVQHNYDAEKKKFLQELKKPQN